jgi:hypothetical protein
MNKLYHLFQEYQNRDIDNHFIEKAFDIMMDYEEELYPYISILYIEKDHGKKLGSYDLESKEITLYRDGIRRLNNKSRVYALGVLRHEIEHARCAKILDDNKDDIESSVIRYSLKDYAYTSGLIPQDMEDLNLLMLTHRIKENYEFDPGERIADIKAWKYIVNLLKNKKNEDLLVARAMLYYSFIRGYRDNRYYLESPTMQFLLNTQQLKEYYLLHKRIDEKDYSFDTRLLCGLPLTKEEYEKDTLMKAKVKKKVR